MRSSIDVVMLRLATRQLQRRRLGREGRKQRTRQRSVLPARHGILAGLSRVVSEQYAAAIIGQLNQEPLYMTLVKNLPPAKPLTPKQRRRLDRRLAVHDFREELARNIAPWAVDDDGA